MNKPAASDLYAKLLATENITIIRAPLRTASFDINSRVLSLPTWKDMTPEVEGMLIGHEVGHALYTTSDYVDAIKNDINKIQGYLNVLEDVRIEKLMKRQYPGIRKTMSEGYRQLNDKDFFGVKKNPDLSTLILIDRINLYFKAGYSCGVTFTPEEKVFVNRAERTESIDDVIQLAKDVFDFSKKTVEKRKEESKAERSAEEDEEMDDLDEEFDFIDASDLPEDLDYEQEESDDEDRKVTDYLGVGKREATSAENQESVIEKELEAKTQDAFDNKLEELADSSTEYRYYKIDDKYVFNPVVSYKTILQETAEVEDNLFDEDKKLLDQFKIDSTRVVNYLIKEFEMRKSATMYKRAVTAKVGSLDMRKIFAYKIKDDLFKRVTTVAAGKNHGMIFLLDWSGSMDSVIQDTVMQVINLAMFCQRAQIPYQVFAFSTQYDVLKTDADMSRLQDYGREFYMHNRNEYKFSNSIHSFSLLEFFSSKMSNSEFNTMVRRMVNPYKVMRCGFGQFSTGGTPLNEALSYMVKYIPEFYKKNNVEKLSLITLTDGEGGSLGTSDNRYLEDRIYCRDTGKYMKVKNFLQDPVTKKSYDVYRNGPSQTESILRMIKDRYDVNSVGFFICQNRRRDLSQAINNHYPNFNGSVDTMIDSLRKSFRDDGFASFKNTGRDDLFIVPTSKLQLEEGEVVVEEKQTARQIAKNFSKVLSGRKTSRVLLNKFIGYVA